MKKFQVNADLITPEEYRVLTGNASLTDGEAQVIINSIYQLADLLVETIREPIPLQTEIQLADAA